MQLKFYITTSLVCVIFILIGCGGVSQQGIQRMKEKLTTSETNMDVINVCYDIIDSKPKDCTLVVALLTHIIDCRTSTNFSHYGECPYESRIKALEVVTGSKAPYKLGEAADALMINFYMDWALQKKLIKSKDDIDVFHPFIRQRAGAIEAISFVVNNDKVTWLKKYDWKEPAIIR